MRAPLTRDRALEVRSLHAQSRDVLRALVSVAGWYRVADAADGTWRYAPVPGAEGLPLDEAVCALLAESREVLARDKGSNEAEQPSDEVHAATVAPHVTPGELAVA